MPSPPQPVADLLAALARALSALGVRWFLFDGQAAILHGAARLSADVDVTVDLGHRSFAELVAALAPDFDSRVADPVRFAEETRVLPFVHRVSHMPLDVILAGPGLEDQFFAGATEQLIGDVRVPVVCAEDLVAMKILAGRPNDLDDVAAIARVHRDDLDLEKIRGTLRLLEAECLSLNLHPTRRARRLPGTTCLHHPRSIAIAAPAVSTSACTTPNATAASGAG